jgi:two-component system, NarL family, sensor kinase
MSRAHAGQPSWEQGGGKPPVGRTGAGVPADRLPTEFEAHGWARTTARRRLLFASHLSLSFLMAYLSAHGMMEMMPGAIRMPVPSLLAVVLAAASMPLMNRMLSLRDHFDEDEFCRCYAIIVRLVRSLTEDSRSTEALSGLAEALARRLRLAHAEVRLQGIGGNPGGEVVSTWGRPRAGSRRFSLIYRGEHMGTLAVSRRKSGDLTANERLLFEELARELAVAAHVLRITNALRRSSQTLIEAREEERRRICRDLHDGVGPVLAAITMRVDAARAMLGVQPAAAEAVLAELHVETKNAVGKVRRLIHELRPPALLGRGLSRAIHDQAAQFEQASGGQLEIRVQVQPDLPRLPPAVELAAYRILSEALTNVAKHARARHCVVRLQLHRDFQLEVADDGVGLPDQVDKGLGLASMRERARELGGECAISRRWPFGTRVLASLPLQ